MENGNYVVKRDDIYVGNVCGIDPKKIRIWPDGMFDYTALDFGLTTEEKLREDFEGQLYLLKRDTEQLDYGYAVWGYPDVLFKRTMLFVLDENNHANDLLYNSPHYPIFNISPNSDCLNSSICILHKTYQLGKVLQYFGYPELLGYTEILEIRKKFFSCDFVLDNCELFGRYETDPHDSGYEVHDSKGNHRTFNEIKQDSVLSHKYFHCFESNRDQMDIRCINGKFVGPMEDAFLPNEREGKIKSLHK